MTPEEKEKREAIAALPFVRADKDGELMLWDCDGVEDLTDIALGERFAELALDVATQHDTPVLIAMTLRDIIKAGRFSPLEAGFVAVIAGRAKVGNHH